MKKRWKWMLPIVFAILLVNGGLQLGAAANPQCSATVGACPSKSCTISAPPGGSVSCSATLTTAVCKSFNADGSLSCQITCNCTRCTTVCQ